MAARSNIQMVFDSGWDSFRSSFNPTAQQRRAASAIMNCRTPKMGFNSMVCPDCGAFAIHYNSCRNRNCPNCQALQKELWIDKRKAEVLDAPYFHIVCTVPAELNPVIYANQELLYDLLHKASSDMLLSLSADRKYLGAVPGIIQVLHTWGRQVNFHPHIHCIVSGAGLSPDGKLLKKGSSFFIPAKVMQAVFRGKFLAGLQLLYSEGKLRFPSSCVKLRNSFAWNEFRDSLYKKDWNVNIKETFNGNGNAIEYLGRYVFRIAISNARILSVRDGNVSFSFFDFKDQRKKVLSISCSEFIRRFLMHVLPPGFQKVRYYGFLNNRARSRRLSEIFRIQGHQSFRSLYSGMSKPDILKRIWNLDIRRCPSCGGSHMTSGPRTLPMRC